MIIFRILGIWFLLASVISMVVDGTKSLAGSTIKFTSLFEHWNQLSTTSLQAAQQFVVDNLGSFVWDPLITAILLWPAWALFGGIGLIFLWTGRKRNRTRIFVN